MKMRNSGKIASLACFISAIFIPIYWFIAAGYDGNCEDNKSEALANGASDVIVVRKYDWEE